MQRVLGMGGFFFRTRDPKALKAWYAKHLGVTEGAETYDDLGWRQNGGITVFEPFSEGTDYFGSPDQQWMINFRVDDLEAMVAQLRAADIDVEVDPERYPNGYFARLYDPEGNPVQLWQPIGKWRDVEEGIDSQ